jgi:hypothetical protein
MTGVVKLKLRDEGARISKLDHFRTIISAAPLKHDHDRDKGNEDAHFRTPTRSH